MHATLRLRTGLAERLRELHHIPSEAAQAALIGVDRTTLRRITAGGHPSGAFVAQFCFAFGLGPGEAFEIVIDQEHNTDSEPGAPGRRVPPEPFLLAIRRIGGP